MLYKFERFKVWIWINEIFIETDFHSNHWLFLEWLMYDLSESKWFFLIMITRSFLYGKNNSKNTTKNWFDFFWVANFFLMLEFAWFMFFSVIIIFKIKKLLANCFSFWVLWVKLFLFANWTRQIYFYHFKRTLIVIKNT